MPRLVVLIGQVLLVLAASGGVFWALAGIADVIWLYPVIALLVALLAIGLMFGVEAEHLEATRDYIIGVFVVGIGFGVFWPALPIIVAWGALKKRREIAHYRAHVAHESRDNHPEGPAGP